MLFYLDLILFTLKRLLTEVISIMTKLKYEVIEEDNGLPIKNIIRSRFNFSSRLMGKLKRQNLVYKNGELTPGWHTVKPGDIISIDFPEEKSDFPPEDIPLEIVYEDDDLLVINKQYGITVHPTKGCPSRTLANGIMHHMLETDQSFKIRFVNRLDTDTSGLLLVGKNSYIQNEITKQMRAKTIDKHYMAVVNGIVEKDEFLIDKPIGRPSQDEIRRAVLAEESGGYPSQTEVKVLERIYSEKFNSQFTIVELHLLTGRTHQIRVHMSSIGHILVGDSLYGDTHLDLINRQALHAYRLSLTHPITKERLDLSSNLPDDIQNLIQRLRSVKA